MNNSNGTDNASFESTFSRQVAAQAARKLKARSRNEKNIWFGLGMSGLLIGCLNAWHWVSQESKAIREDKDD
jgi:ATP synthase protein I